MCSLEGVATLCCLLFHLLLASPIISDRQKIKQKKSQLFDSVIASYVFLTRLTRRPSSGSEAFDDEDAAPECLAMTASVLLFNIMLLLHMVHISP